MAQKAADQPSINRRPAGPPVMPVTIGSWRSKTVAIPKLARMVAALPSRHFIPLNAALDRAKDCLGLHSLAARDLTQHAHVGRLTVAVRLIWPWGTEWSFILRPVFWQWHDIEDGPRFWESLPDERAARVVGPIKLIGNWHFFVGRKRFDRLYSTAASPTPSAKPTLKAPSPPPDPKKWLIPMQVEFARVPTRRRAAWIREKAFPQMQRELGDMAPWKNSGSLQRAMYPGRKKI